MTVWCYASSRARYRLPPSYAMSGTDIRSSYAISGTDAMSGTDTGYSYAMSGTDIGPMIEQAHSDVRY
eukprot:3004976-Rhodomonas_salina.1